MSRSESNTTPTISATDESQGTSDTRIKVDFNQHGKPIGRNAAKFSTRLGCLTRTHCPPIYAEWLDEGLKDNKLDLWKGIQAEFIVPEEYKDAQLVDANQLWKNWKSSLRRHCDKYSTITEKKRNWPEKMGVKKEDWYIFVDIEATEDARLRREKGKVARKEMNNPHTSGRRGAARTEEILVANNPNEPGTRTDLFMATHTRPDGTYLNEEIGEKMVFGIDGRGTVKGYGHGVSKTTLTVAAPYKKKAQEEYMSRMELQHQVDNMERQIAEDRRQMAEDRRECREMQEQLSTLLGSQGSGQRSLRHFSASAPLFHEGPMNSLPRQSSISAQQACELLSIGGRVVAFGTISTNSDGTTYKVIIDEVEDWTAELFGVIGKTFGDIDVGHTVDWPLILTRLV